jgi:hypothetical protein
VVLTAPSTAQRAEELALQGLSQMVSQETHRVVVGFAAIHGRVVWASDVPNGVFPEVADKICKPGTASRLRRRNAQDAAKRRPRPASLRAFSQPSPTCVSARQLPGRQSVRVIRQRSHLRSRPDTLRGESKLGGLTRATSGGDESSLLFCDVTMMQNWGTEIAHTWLFAHNAALHRTYAPVPYHTLTVQA